jgi:hypothetical protein
MSSLFIGVQPSQIGGLSMFIGLKKNNPGDSGDHDGCTDGPLVFLV